MLDALCNWLANNPRPTCLLIIAAIVMVGRYEAIDVMRMMP